MAQLNNKELTTLPVGRLGLIPLDSCRPLGEKVNEWLVKWRKERENPELGTCAFEGYQRDSYIINVKTLVSVPVKEKARSVNPYVVTIFMLWLMSATTVSTTRSADTPT